MNISVYRLALPLLFGFCVLCFPSSVFAQSSTVLDPAQSIKDMENVIKPALQESTEWGLTAGLGIVSASAFYALLVRIVKA